MVNKSRGVVLEEPSGDESVGRGQHANEGILGGTLGQFGVPAPGNSKAAKIGEIQLVGLEGRDDGVNLFGSVFQLGQASPVLDVGFDPLVDLGLRGFRRCAVLQYWAIGANNIGMEGVRRSSRRWSGLLWFWCRSLEVTVQSASRARRSRRGDVRLGFVQTQAFTISRSFRFGRAVDR